MRRTCFLLGLCLAAGCAASPTQIGQTAGGIAGGAIVPGIGAPLGALLGTLVGLVVEQQVDKSRERKERVELGQQLGTSTSVAELAAPPEEPVGRPTRVWVDERLENGRVMAGHFDVRSIP